MMKTILITGGSRGIGKATALAAANGYQVAFTFNKNEAAANGLVSELSLKCHARAYKCDVSSSADVRKTIKNVLKDFGKIDVLINNAGVAEDILFQDISDESWRKMMGVNLDGAFYVCREVVPSMISRGNGAIVNVSSIWGVTGASMETHYSASKAGLIGLTKALAKELAPSGITVNAVAPGAVDTDMMKQYTEEETAAFVNEIPLGRLGKPEEIAEAILFLAEAKYITGQVLGVNGGYVI